MVRDSCAVIHSVRDKRSFKIRLSPSPLICPISVWYITHDRIPLSLRPLVSVP